MSVTRFVPAALVAAVVLLPASASAQQIGAKAGVNFASLSNTEDFIPEDGQRIGLAAGLFVTVPATERLSFQIEGLYTEKGVTGSLEEFGIPIEGNLRLQYLEVPVLGRADFGTPGSSSNFYIVAGAAPAFKLDARLKLEALGEEETVDLSDDMESFDFGLVGGAGLELGRLGLEARYTHGLLSISKDDADDEPVKNKVFTVSVSYRFR